MDYRGDTSDEFEQIEALTISQWLVVLLLHARQLIAQVIGLFIALSFGLLMSNHPTYVDAELEHIVSDLKHSNGTESKDLAEFLEKLRTLRESRNLAWKELPWVHVQSQVRESLPSSPSLGQEFTLIDVTLEGRELSRVTISTFQSHILRRIELQANLVERVRLGHSAKISTKIQDRLSVVWATIRNDEFDIDPFLESPQSAVALTTFTKRIGTYRLLEPTLTRSLISQVNAWHQNVFGGLTVEYVSEQAPGSPCHAPVWIVTPIILGERHLDYQVTGSSLRDAWEEAARLIATSGHC
ncbi:hypothetical protein RSAG8_08542, partial [Rhizoctonia solani AG-8 WAC10335]